MGVADHQLYPREAALYCFAEACGYERGNELAPEALALTVAHLEAQQLKASVGIDAHGDDHGPGANLQGLTQPAVEIGSVHVVVGVAGLL